MSHCVRHAFVILACLASMRGAGALEMIGAGVPWSVPVTSLQEARFRTTLHQQYDFSCGSAALATLLTFQYGIHTTEAAVFEAMFAGGDQNKIRREGFSLLDMRNYLDAQGLVADGYEVPLDKLAEARIPAIALIDDGGYHHFVVVKGLTAGRVLIGDPSRGTRLMLREDFERLWTSRILFVIHAQRRADVGAPRFNAVDDWARAPLAPIAAGVDRTGLDAQTLMRMGPGDF
jgi:predicted double-glycine peptidase